MKRLRFLLIIPVFISFMIVYFIGNSFLRKDEPLIHDYIPDEVDVLVEFDIKHFGSAFVYNMLYNSEYFNKKIPFPKGSDRKEIPDMGMSFTQNFVFAVERWGEGDFYYFIFQLDSKDYFDSFMGKLMESNENLVFASNAEVGIMGFSDHVDRTVSSEYLNEVINQNIESIRTKYDLIEKFNWDRDINIHLNTQAFIEGNKLEDIFASVDLISNAANFDIEYTSNQVYEVQPLGGKTLKAKNLHMSSTMKFEDILSTFGLRNIQSINSLPEIKKWSINNLGSQIEMQSGVKADSIQEIMKVQSPMQEITIDGKDKFGLFLEQQGIKIALNTEGKFEVLLEPENKSEFIAYLKGLASQGIIKLDSTYNLISMGQFGKHKFKWIDNYFIIYPKNQDDVELVDVPNKGSYFYMNFDLNPFLENVKMLGDGSFYAAGGVAFFNNYKGGFQQLMSNFDKVQVTLFKEKEKIKIHSELTFKNTEGVAIIELMSAFMKSSIMNFSL